MKSLLKIAFIFLAVFTYRPTIAQEATVDTTIISNDNNGIAAPPEKKDEEGTDNETKTHKYERRYIDENRLQGFRSKRAFKYPDLESDTLEVKREPPPQQTTRFKGIDGTVFLWLIVAVGIIILILQLSGVNMRQLFSQPAKRKGERMEVISQNIHEIPFDTAIREAIYAGNYSLATRLMYLQGLKLLSDKGLITWHENKTNWQYVYELKNVGLRSSFRTVTSIFEYVQYGSMQVQKEKFPYVQDAFDNFKKHVI